MRLGQLIKTSCRKGLSGYSGIQIQAMSPDVTVAQRADVEELRGYEQPSFRSLYPESPTESDIKRLCPPEFRLTILKNGGLAFTRLVYAGADYSGRDGNYIAHSLVLTDRLGRYPIDLLNWDGWVGEVSDEPPLLQTVPIDRIPSSNLSLAHISSFLKQHERAAKCLPSMIQAILARKIENRPIVVRDQYANLCTWVACITKAFPRHLEKQIQFSSYSNSQIPGIDIQCTSECSEFELGSDVISRRAFVFDFVDFRFSTLELATCRFSERIASLLIDRPEAVSDFTSFVDGFVEPIPLEAVPEIFDCFEAIFLGSSHLEVTHVETVLQLASSDAERGSHLIEKLIESLEDWSERNETCDRGLIAQQIANGFAGVNRECQTKLVSCLNNLLWHELHMAGQDWGQIDDSLRKVDQVSCDMEAQEKDNLNVILKQRLRANKNVDDVFAFALSRVGSSLTPPFRNPTILSLIKQSVSADGSQRILRRLLLLAAERSEAEFAHFCNELSGDDYTREGIKAVGSTLVEILDGMSPRQAERYRNSLAKNGYHHILIAELSARRQSEDGDLLDLLKQLGQVIPKMKGPPIREIRNILGEMWADSDATERLQISKWALGNSSLLLELDQSLRWKMLDVLSREIPLDPAERRNAKLAKQLGQVCIKLHLNPPVSIQIRAFIGELRACRDFDQARSVCTSQNLRLGVEEQQPVATLILAALLPRCCTAKEHWQQLGVCFGVVENNPKILSAYSEFLSGKKMNKVSVDGGVAYVLAALGFDKVYAPSQDFVNAAERNVDEWLVSIPDALFKQICESVSQKIDRTSLEFSVWVDRCSDIRKSRGSLFRKVSRFLGISRKVRELFQ